jgi:hypothetical protein
MTLDRKFGRTEGGLGFNSWQLLDLLFFDYFDLILC